MLWLARRASLVVVLLLTSVGTASAECAWVLWTFTSISVDKATLDEWQPLNAYAILEECEKQRQAMQQKMSRRSLRSEIKIVTYNCFPDTIDPRGPKGAR